MYCYRCKERKTLSEMSHNEHGLTKTCTKCNLISIEEKVKVKKAKRKAFSKKFNEFIKSTYTNMCHNK